MGKASKCCHTLCIMQIKAHFIVILQICFAHSMIGCSIVNLLCYCVCGEPRPSSDLLVLFVISNQLLLVITIITAYLITTNDHAPRQKKQVACHYTSLLAKTSDWTDDCFRHNMHTKYILQLRYEEVVLSFCTRVYQSPSLLLVDG